MACLQIPLNYRKGKIKGNVASVIQHCIFIEFRHVEDETSTLTEN